MWSLVSAATASKQVTLSGHKGTSEDASGRDPASVANAATEPDGAAAAATPARRNAFTRKKPVGSFRNNGTRLGPGGGARQFGSGGGPLKRLPARKPSDGIRERTPLDTESRKAGSPAAAAALTEKQPGMKTSSAEREDNENPTTVITPAGINPGTGVQSGGSSSEPALSHDDSAEQSAAGAGTESRESAMGTEAAEVHLPASSTPERGNGQCLNKIKVTHFKLPPKDRVGGGCADGTPTEGGTSTPDARPGSSETEPLSSATVEDPLHQLLADTFSGLKIQTFSVHLAKPSGLDSDADTMRQQILKGLTPLSSAAAAAPYSLTSSSRTSPLLPSSLSPNSLSSSITSSSSSSSSSSPPPLLAPLSSSPSPESLSPTSPPTSPPSPSSSSSSHALDISDLGNNPEVAKITNDESVTGRGSLGTKQNQTHTPREGGAVPPFRRPPAKGPYRPYHQNGSPFQNRTRPNLRHPPRRFQPQNAERTDTDLVSTSELPSKSSSSSSSSSKESLTVTVYSVQEEDVNTDRAGQKPKLVSLGRNQTKPWRGGPVRRPPPNGAYPQRLPPHLRQFQNRTPTNSSMPYRTLKPEVPEAEAERTESTSGESPSQSSSSEDSASVIGSDNLESASSEKSEGVTALMSIEDNHNQTTTLSAGVLPTRGASPDVVSQRGPHPNADSVLDRTRPNFIPSTPPHHPFNPDMETETGHASSGETNQTVRMNGKRPFYRQPPNGAYPKRTHPYAARFQNRTRPILRPPHRPQTGLPRKPLAPRKINGVDSITRSAGIQNGHSPKPDSTLIIQPNQSEEHGVHTPTDTVQTVQSRVPDTTNVIQTNQLEGDDGTAERQTSPSGETGIGHGIQTTQPDETREPKLRDQFDLSGEEGTIHRDGGVTHTGSGRDTSTEGVRVNRLTDSTAAAQPTTDNSPDPVNQGTLKPASGRKKTILPGRKRTPGHPQMRNNTAVSQEGRDSKMARPGGPKAPAASKIKDSSSGGSSAIHSPEDSPSEGTAREPLDHVGVKNVGSDGFTVVWDAPEGKYTNFIVTSEEQDVKGVERGKKEDAGRGESGQSEENTLPISDVRPTVGVHGSTTAAPSTGSDKTVTKVVPGTARSCQFQNLPPQTPFNVTLLGKGPGLLSKLHKLVISTGPEPPSNLVFSEVTENSLTVSWTKPKNHVDAFKVTYMHMEEGEPVSVSVDSGDSTLDLSQLSPGSSYEISVISVLGLDESDPIKDLTMTLPDPPTDLRAINITDSQALLLWRPALARVDKYSIVYGSEKGSDMRITVSGNAAEQPLNGLEGSTTYTVTITSQLGSLESSPASTVFTTTGGYGKDGPHELEASQVTPRTALLSWKPPPGAVGSYRLTYQTEGQEMMEVIVDATVTEYKLVKLHPGAKYTASLQAESRGIYTGAISTEFTTGTLRYPFPTDCSQELLNGIRESGEAEIFPMGRPGLSLMVYCDQETDGGGWTVFQRRQDGSVDFFRGWKDYSRGFGDLNGEFWLGLENLHNLTTATKMGLRVDLREGSEAVFAKYTTFQVAKKNYKLTVAGYSGTAGDSMTYHNGRLFSTKDRDPSPFITRCAMSYRGGWWYKNCHEANLNGVYGIDVNHQGVIWTSWKGKEHSIPFTEMKMRPASFHPPPFHG